MRNEVVEGNAEGIAAVVGLDRNPEDRKQKRSVNPELKVWIDNVFIPAMVRLYLANSVPDEDNGTTERVQ
jgi:hypothetical protein